ncbi:MAG: penicillin-binding protein 2 [Clostridiales bacterium]|nr:penicillin-binding protein 2 [Clostridiales bacterium]
MKQQRFRFKLLALLLFGLFALLAVYGVYSINTYGNRWFAYARNPRVREQKANVTAGNIYDRNGVLLASTVEGKRVYQADEAARRAVVHVIGDSEGQVSNGVEGFQTAYLYGFKASLVERFNDLFSSEPRRGDDVHLSLDSDLCTAIARAFSAHPLTQGRNGAAVVMNYKTGEVVAEISLPSFDPMNPTGVAAGSEVYWNRATQSLYPPGSTFKVITTAAALENIPGVTDISIACTGGLDVDGQAIRDYGNAVHKSLTLKQAFTKSCNNVYALLALDMGDAALRKTAESFGFNANFLFRDLVVENSAYPTAQRTRFEVAMSGFGQSSIGATPMHLCLVAAAIANDGVMMEPTLLRKATTPSGSLRATFGPRVYRTALSPATAATLQEYMRAVVTSGTGTRASVNGLTICGKTGSAESSRNGQAVTHGLFIGYIDSDALPFAVCVVVENIPDGQGGGSTAAPIAADIFTYLRDNAEKVTH